MALYTLLVNVYIILCIIKKLIKRFISEVAMSGTDRKVFLWSSFCKQTVWITNAGLNGMLSLCSLVLQNVQLLMLWEKVFTWVRARKSWFLTSGFLWSVYSSFLLSKIVIFNYYLKKKYHFWGKWFCNHRVSFSGKCWRCTWCMWSPTHTFYNIPIFLNIGCANTGNSPFP